VIYRDGEQVFGFSVSAVTETRSETELGGLGLGEGPLGCVSSRATYAIRARLSD
jgi:hypothetical protein